MHVSLGHVSPVLGCAWPFGRTWPFLRHAGTPVRVRFFDPEDRARYQPIPISGISAGALADGMGCLGVTIWRTELMFQVPSAVISEVARTLLLVGADEHSQRAS